VSTAILAKRPVLVDRLGATSVLTNIAYVAAGVALLAVVAQVQIPMWPVPITGQTFGILVVGSALGLWRAIVASVAYIGIAVAGLPVLAASAVDRENPVTGLAFTVGPDWVHTTGVAVFSIATFGYLVGFVFASALVGWFAERKWERKFLTAVLSFVLAEVVIYAFGLPWLSVWLGTQGYPNDVAATLSAGFSNYVIGDLIKAVAAGALLPLAWKLVNRKG
jgi:biotin transport system substrate-specific component